jgi:hypothetical protein
MEAKPPTGDEAVTVLLCDRLGTPNHEVVYIFSLLLKKFRIKKVIDRSNMEDTVNFCFSFMLSFNQEYGLP